MSEQIDLEYGTRKVLAYLVEENSSEKPCASLNEVKAELGDEVSDDIRILEREGVLTYFRGEEPGEGYVQLLPTYFGEARKISEGKNTDSIPRISHPPGERELINYASTS